MNYISNKEIIKHAFKLYCDEYDFCYEQGANIDVEYAIDKALKELKISVNESRYYHLLNLMEKTYLGY